MASTEDLLPCVEVTRTGQDGQPVDAAVIWLHGLGANGHDFEPIVPELPLPADLSVRFVFPHAPEIPVTVNGGAIMPAWYDILELSLARKVDHAQLMASAEKIRTLIQRERERGIRSNRIVLAGFSQGGAVAYQTALTHPEPLAGLLAMSTYFATEGTLEADPANADLPIAIQHGEYDPMVPESLGQAAHAALQVRGYQPTYQRYPLEHQVCMEQIHDIGQWIGSVLTF